MTLFFLLSLVLLVVTVYILESISDYKADEPKKSTKRESYYENWNEDYESWKIKKEAEDKSKTIQKINKLFDLLVKDFSNNPYYDKLTLLGSSSIISFIYKFENGFKFTLNDREVRVYNRIGENISSYRLNDIYHLKFLKLILEMKQKTQHRNTQSKYNSGGKTKEETKVNSTGNTRLDKINEKISLREEQLRKMKTNDPERDALVNELNTYKNIAKKIKSKIK